MKKEHRTSSCPFCKNSEPAIAVSDVSSAEYEGYACFCPKCGAEGPIKKTEVLAIKAWNRAPRNDGSDGSE